MYTNKYLTCLKPTPKGIIILFSFCLLLLFNYGCKSIKSKEPFTEGIIEYSISYLDKVPPKFDSNMRPDRMVVRFKDYNTINRIEALSGAFTFAFIQDLSSNTSTTLVKIFNKKLYYQEAIDENQFHFAYNSMPNLTFKKVDETQVFLGLNCMKAIATYSDSSSHSFEILYTKDIKINSPNYNTPFEEIDGIMLKFSVVLFNQMMQITATSVKQAKLPKDEFKIPVDFEMVNKETMQEVIYLFQ